MALEAGSSAAPYSPHVVLFSALSVAGAFVKQYYQTLLSAQQDAYKFYNDSSILGRPDSNGNMLSVTTIDGIKEQLLSADFTDSLVELETVDSQPSHVGGVLISVSGSFTIEAMKRKFTQSFFLAPQKDGGYFVLNDIIRFAKPLSQAKDVVANNDNESTQSTTLQAEPETASINEHTVPNIPPTGNTHVIEAMSTSPNVVSPVKIVVDACMKVVNKDTEKVPGDAPATPALVEKNAVNKSIGKIWGAAQAPASAEKAVHKATEKMPGAAQAAASAEKAVNKATEKMPVAAQTHASAEKGVNKATEKMPVAAPAPPASTEKLVNKDNEKMSEAASAPPTSTEKEVTKKTYASIVKTTRDGIPPTPTAKPKPNPRPNPAQTVEKSVSSPSKPDHATNTAPSADKNVSKNKSSDEPGYSIFVKNLPYEATVEMVEKEFSKFGAVKPGGIQVKKCQPDRFCFGFVEFESQDSMVAAIEAFSVYFDSRESYIEEKRTKTRGRIGFIRRRMGTMYCFCIINGRLLLNQGGYVVLSNLVVDGVITRGDDNGGRFQSGRGGYHGDNYRGPGGFRNNGYYHDGERNDLRNQNDFSGRGRVPQGNGYHQNGNGYHHQNGNGYAGNGFQQRRPYNNNNGNGRVERSNGPRQQAPAAA
ncbi:hypothetical protein U9M48_015818 [Paspalum notatum var. saurae]|uniref:Uncharacterized protein n=1 Tax=Paspalum notatum var. saurae TaxID=547442 RepID=A0AAQ3WM73_PASNO